METDVLDPLAPSPRGHWSAGGVRVRRRIGPHRPHAAPDSVCTPRFCALRRGALLTVEHDLSPEELCDELAVLLAEQLVDTGALHGQCEFELVFTGVVRTTVDGAMPSWLRFYRNSLTMLETGVTAFAPIHEHAAALTRGLRLVDLGSCFGFFPLRMSALGFDVTATDLSGPTMELLELASRRLHRPLHTICADAARVPLPDRCADTVTALHLIEHLATDEVDAVAHEALRLARRRVIIAVPFEEEPRECYGHRQRFDATVLHRLADRLRGAHPDVATSVHEFHGGWLILDRHQDRE